MKTFLWNIPIKVTKTIRQCTVALFSTNRDEVRKLMEKKRETFLMNEMKRFG